LRIVGIMVTLMVASVSVTCVSAASNDVYENGMNILKGTLNMNGEVVDKTKSVLSEMKELDDLLGEVSKKGVDVSSVKPNVDLSIKYLNDALSLYEWSYSVLNSMINKLNGSSSDVMVDVIDGNNGVLSARYYLEYSIRDLNDLGKMVSKAVGECRDFLAGKVGKDEFVSELKGTLTSGAGVVGLSASVRDSAYKVAAFVDASWERLSGDEKEESVVKASRMRSYLTTFGLLVGLLATFYALSHENFLEFLEVASEVLSELVSLVSEIASVLVTSPYQSVIGGGF